jgi:hypothetical protein
VVLFGGGLALGGAALRPHVDPSPVFQVSCYGTTPPSSAVAKVEFDTEAHAASARLDPAAACENIQVHNAQSGEIDSIVTGLMNQGSTCGTVTTDDGPTWMFEQTGDGFSVTTGTFTDPLGPDCATVHVAHVTSPSIQHFGGIACAVSEGQVNVYASSSTDASAVCGANGFAVYSSTTAK